MKKKRVRFKANFRVTGYDDDTYAWSCGCDPPSMFGYKSKRVETTIINRLRKLMFYMIDISDRK